MIMTPTQLCFASGRGKQRMNEVNAQDIEIKDLITKNA